MFFLASVWLFRTLVYLPQTIPKWPQFFWDDPNFLGFIPNDPKKLGIFWDLLGSIPKHPRILGWKISSKNSWDLLGFFGIGLGWPQTNPKKPQKIPRILGWSQKFGAKCAGAICIMIWLLIILIIWIICLWYNQHKIYIIGRHIFYELYFRFMHIIHVINI